MYHEKETDHNTKDCPIFREAKKNMGQASIQASSNPSDKQINHTIAWPQPPPQFYAPYNPEPRRHPQPSMFPHQQPSLQIAYPPPLPQITYPQQNTQVQQPKAEPNQQPQGHFPKPPQLNNNFPTHRTIHAITGGSSSEFKNKRQ